MVRNVTLNTYVSPELNVMLWEKEDVIRTSSLENNDVTTLDMDWDSL